MMSLCLSFSCTIDHVVGFKVIACAVAASFNSTKGQWLSPVGNTARVEGSARGSVSCIVIALFDTAIASCFAILHLGLFEGCTRSTRGDYREGFPSWCCQSLHGSFLHVVLGTCERNWELSIGAASSTGGTEGRSEEVQVVLALCYCLGSGFLTAVECSSVCC